MLTGGCFQNALLTERVLAALTPEFSVYRHGEVPPGDGGLALGQAVRRRARSRAGSRRRSLMCLGVPGRVLEVDGLTATVDFWGVRRQVRLDVVDEPVAPGDYILNHVGFAIRRIPAEEIGETLASTRPCSPRRAGRPDGRRRARRDERHGAGGPR